MEVLPIIIIIIVILIIETTIIRMIRMIRKTKKNTKNNNVWYIWSSSHTKKSVLSLSLSRCAGATHLLRCSGFRQAEQKHR